MYLPNDPIMLKSVLNTYLRDKYKDLEDLCDDLDLNIDDLLEKLSNAGIKYIKEIKQFR